MANTASAIVYVLKQEDSRMTGVVTDDPRDAGGRTRWGIAERFHPELTSTGFFDSMSEADSLAVAQSVYSSAYSSQLMLPSIASQQVANALLSFAVNEGVITSIKVLQAALGFSVLDIDGKFGPNTLNAVNGYTNLLAMLADRQRFHYESIVAANPSQQCFLKGWLNRVQEDCAVS